MSTRKPAGLPIDLPARFPAGRYPIVRAIWSAVEAGALYAGTSRFGIPTARRLGWSCCTRRRANGSKGGGTGTVDDGSERNGGGAEGAA